MGGFLPRGAAEWLSPVNCCLVECTRGEGPTLRILLGALEGVVTTGLLKNQKGESASIINLILGCFCLHILKKSLGQEQHKATVQLVIKLPVSGHVGSSKTVHF